VVLPGCDRTHALHSAERIRSAVAGAPVLADQLEIPVTISIGVTAVTANASEKEVLAVADEALYQAKSSGRNRAAVL
jgi:diguanylate cyclase (GGDEF)-like protein